MIRRNVILGHRAENREKNRNPSIVPPDERRPYLTSFQSGYNSTTNNDAGRIFANPMLMLNSFYGIDTDITMIPLQ